MPIISCIAFVIVCYCTRHVLYPSSGPLFQFTNSLGQAAYVHPYVKPLNPGVNGYMAKNGSIYSGLIVHGIIGVVAMGVYMLPRDLRCF